MSYQVKLADNECLYEKANTFTFNVYNAGVAVKPTSALISIWANDEEQKVTEATATISDSSPYNITYEASASVFDDYTENWRIRIDYIHGGNTRYVSFFFDVVKNKIYCDVIQSDLEKLHPELNDDLHSGLSNYQPFIDAAFDDVKTDIKAFGDRPVLMLDGSQVHRLILYKSLEKIFFDFSNSVDDISWEKHKKCISMYEKELGSLRLKYDRDQDEVADGIEKQYHDIRVIS